MNPKSIILRDTSLIRRKNKTQSTIHSPSQTHNPVGWKLKIHNPSPILSKILDPQNPDTPLRGLYNLNEQSRIRSSVECRIRDTGMIHSWHIHDAF